MQRKELLRHLDETTSYDVFRRVAHRLDLLDGLSPPPVSPGVDSVRMSKKASKHGKQKKSQSYMTGEL